MMIRSVASVEELKAVQGQLAELYGWTSSRRERDLAALLEQFGRDPGLMLVAETARSLRGAVFASDRGQDGTLLLTHVGVFPRHQRTGVGSALWAEMEQRARKRGKGRLLLGAVQGAELFYLNL
ncbi:MAG: hypothetical protein CL878_14435 [Dehalococcoidia bacterium]|nr:hypothetical protein [Dehalococcoidia bacterium]